MRVTPTVFALLFAPSLLSAATIHVPGDQPTIQAGIDAAAEGDTVLVACGTYYESELSLSPHIALLGESGVPDCVVIDGESSACIVNAVSCGTVTIEGITFRGGGSPDYVHGGGIKFVNTSGLVRNVVFEDCYTSAQGGAVFAEGSSCVDFEACVFRYCTSRLGGAFSCSDGYYNFTQCLFYGNFASANGAAIVSLPS